MLRLLFGLAVLSGCQNHMSSPDESKPSVDFNHQVSTLFTLRDYKVKILVPTLGMVAVTVDGINQLAGPPTFVVLDQKKSFSSKLNLESLTVFNQDGELIGSVLYHRPNQVPSLEIRIFDSKTAQKAIEHSCPTPGGMKPMELPKKPEDDDFLKAKDYRSEKKGSCGKRSIEIF